MRGGQEGRSDNFSSEFRTATKSFALLCGMIPLLTMPLGVVPTAARGIRVVARRMTAFFILCPKTRAN